MVRDEIDVLPATIEHMLTQVDMVIVADQNSSDGTFEWLHDRQFAEPHGRLNVCCVTDPAYYQSRIMSGLAESARAVHHADWVVCFDADEIWLARSGRRIADVLKELPPEVLIAEADLWDHISTGRDRDEPNPVVRMGWRRSYPAPLPKVAVRALGGITIAQGNHSATFEGVDLPGRVANLLTVRHYPYRSEDQTLRKIRNGAEAYAATDLVETEGAHWRGWGAILESQGEQAIRDLFRKWHWRADPRQPLAIDGELQPPLVFDPAPIGEAACRTT
jgi:hypothetical protein